MNYVKNNRLTPKEKHFFTTLSTYIQKPLFFFGSVQRFDYIKGMSDIDVAIFTDNIPSTLTKIQILLNYNKPVSKFIYKTNLSQTIVYGNKLMYTAPDKDILAEITIYNNKDKNAIIQDQLSKINIPLYVSILLLIVKYIYTLNMISSKDYRYYKNYILRIVPHPSGDDLFIKI
jgi:predicted nucleotidyltransferase